MLPLLSATLALASVAPAAVRPVLDPLALVQDKASQKGGEDLQSFIASLDAALHDTGDGTNQNWQEHFINFKALTTEKKREEPKNPIN